MIPAALGQAEFTVSTFRKAERLGSDDTNERGAVGVVVALIEEELLTDADVARGRARFNKEVENGINRVIKTLRMETDFELQSGDVAALKERVADAVNSAVVAGVGSFLRGFLAGDKEIGTDFFLASETKEIDDSTPAQRISRRPRCAPSTASARPRDHHARLRTRREDQLVRGRTDLLAP